MGKVELRIEIDAHLLEQARAADVHFDSLVERALKAALGSGAEDRARRWAEENAQAIEDHKARIEREGVFGDDLRTW